MNKKKIAAMLLATMILNISSTTMNVFAEDLNSEVTKVEETDKVDTTKATVSKFDLENDKNLDKYNEVFQVKRDDIQSITNNGGQYDKSNIEKAIDGNLNTHWETGTPNKPGFTNEVTVTFKEPTDINRIVYSARRDGARGKGFSKEFKIYSSPTDSGDDFTLVASGEYKGSNKDRIEIKFKNTSFKRLKFVFDKADQDWASASEFTFYKEDPVRDSINSLFTDSKMNKLSDKFNNLEAIEALDKEAQKNPLYDEYKESIENAKAILEEDEIVSNDCNFRKVNYSNNKEYNEKYRMSYDNIKSIKTNGGHYADKKIENAIDGNLDTYWETKTSNSGDFKNEVEVEFKNPVVLDRILYGARQSDIKGFGEDVSIYASRTSKGDTYKFVSEGKGQDTKGLVEVKFAPTKFKRVKIVFNKSKQNSASLDEIMFYKPDEVLDKLNSIFTDNTYSKLSDNCNTEDKLNKLEKEAESHPLYEDYKEDIEDAKAILNDKKTEAVVSNLKSVDYGNSPFYNEDFRMSYDNIESIKNNGGNYADKYIKNAIDGKLDTYWETDTLNSKDFKNEVEVEFKNPVVLDRILYGARQSDLKGFGEDVSIYGSRTSKGDTYKLVAEGKGQDTKGLVEVKFAPTEFKRVKIVFNKSNQNSATLNEIMFYTPDEVYNEIPKLFTDGTMSELSPEYNDINKIKALEEKAKENALYMAFKPSLDLAESLVSNSKKEDVIELERRGNSVEAAKKRKVWNFQDWQVTGYTARPNDKIKVYVDVPEGEPTPTLIYKQAFTENGATRTFNLKPGENDIVIPYLDEKANGIPEGVIQGGELFFTNYQSDKQTRAPRVRIEGAQKYPVFILGKSKDEEVMKELEAYVDKIKKDPQNTPDVFAISGDKSLELVQATYALNWYKHNDRTPSYTAKAWDDYIKEAMDFWGFDNSSEVNSDFNFRMVPMLKNLGSGVFMNAINGTIGVRPGNQDSILDANKGWGVAHELGHNFDTGGRTIAEVTNNMMSLHFQEKYEGKTKMTNEDIWGKRIYPKVGLDDYSNNKLGGGTDLTQIAPLWQLTLYDNTFYGKFERQFREKDFGNKSREDIYKSWVVAASDAMQLDLTEFFARHGIFVDEKVKEEIGKKYKKPDKKIYFMNESAYNYKGNGFTDKAKVDVNTVGENGKVKFVFSINDEDKNNIMGYEIRKDGKYVGYAYKNTFVDENSNLDEDGIYEVIPYDKKLNTLDPIEVESIRPQLSVEPVITLTLGEEFNPLDYADALDMKGNSLKGSLKVKENNVDPSKLGEYNVTYSIVSEKGKEYTKSAKVNVVSEKDYISDLTPIKSQNGYGTVRKDKSISGNTISLLRDGSYADYKKGLGLHAPAEYVYNIEGKNYEYFEAYVGVDKAMVSRDNSSVVFKVLVDGEEKFNSGVMKSDSNEKYVKVDLKGAKELTLIVEDGGDGNGSDHADFADAKLVTTNSIPKLNIPESTAVELGHPMDFKGEYSASDIEDGNLTDKVKVEGDVNFDKTGDYKITYTVEDKDGNKVSKDRIISVIDMKDFTYLSDLDWNKETHTYTAPKKDVTVDNHKLTLTKENGEAVTYDKGIGSHSTSTITYDLTGKDYDLFTSYVGVDREVYNSVGSVSFEVYVDGEKKFDSGVMTSQTPEKFVQVSLSGAKELKLVVTDGKNGDGSDHATWGDCKLYTAKENGSSIDRSKLNDLMEKAEALDPSLYEEASFKALQNSLNEAKEGLKDGYSQEEVDKLYENLNNSYKGLVELRNFTKLQTLVDNSKTLNELNYEPSGFKAYKDLVDKANKILETKEGTQEQIDEMSSKLENAYNKLVLRSNKVELEKLIKNAKEVKQGNYNKDRWDNFTWAIQYASDIYNNVNASDEDIHSAIFTLSYMKHELITN